jgi:hypothetical protein
MVCVAAAAVLAATDVPERGGFPTTMEFFAGLRAERHRVVGRCLRAGGRKSGTRSALLCGAVSDGIPWRCL